MQIAAIAKRVARAAGRCALLLAVAAPIFCAPLARAQIVDCERLRATIEAMPRGDSASEQAAAQLRVDIERLAARADAIGCNNQQFLFFGSPPPPECGGLKQKLAGMRGQYESLRARGGDIVRRQGLIAQYSASCGDGQPFLDDEEPRERGAGVSRGGGEAICVRKCDGYFFPLTPGMSSSRAEQLRGLCQALCPNADISLYSRAAHADISTAIAADSGDSYSDLPDALKYTRKLDPSCSCRKPMQGWAEVLGGAEQILTDIDGERPGEGPLTPKQADDRSRVQPASNPAEQAPSRPKKPKAKAKPAVSPLDPPDRF
jgi:hypothetical protein